MSVKIRLTRRGRKKKAIYDVIVADAIAPRDGRFIEKIGTYNPNSNPATINLNDEKALDWIMKGAQPTDTARAILSEKGIMFKKHLQIGVNKGAVTQEQADARFQEWFENKEKQSDAKITTLTEAGNKLAKEKFDAEKKVNEARAASILRKKQAAEAALVAEIVEAGATEEEKALEEEALEAVVEETTTEAVKEEATTEAVKEEATTEAVKEESTTEAVKEETATKETKPAE